MNDYVKTMRAMIGKETLLTIGCGCILEDDRGRILLQKRRDLSLWVIPGGIMEIGETFLEAVIREVKEETGLTVLRPQLFGIYSGPEGLTEYHNGDKVFSVQIIFYSKEYEGTLKQTADEESLAHAFFHKQELPDSINPHQARFILDWARGEKTPVIR
ncbi:NUDIX domain-containing protein [Brevibacillus ruminantium]|uniref:NUDIX domain-containing protein n=1 Tax=Brevibacillus ruminantium TaxID=2950604 RepID=A0ABY4WPW1_9BACL|nr:NUDIX domain-containing protein [Brevibacillus ruminantium]USG68183.1 NUDIX domain-containing protein [Brevibacillus ruminantium]